MRRRLGRWLSSWGYAVMSEGLRGWRWRQYRCGNRLLGLGLDLEFPQRREGRRSV